MLTQGQLLVFELVCPLLSRRRLKILSLVSKHLEALTFSWRFRELVPLHTAWFTEGECTAPSTTLFYPLDPKEAPPRDPEALRWDVVVKKAGPCVRKITIVVEKSAWKGSDDLPTPEHGTAVIIKAFPFLRDLKIVSGTAHNSESNVRPWNFDPIAHAICGMTRLRSLNLGNDFGEAVNFTPSLVETCAMEIEELSICIRRQRDAAFCCHLLNGARKTLRCLSVLWGLPPRSEEHPTVTRDVISPVLQTGSYEHLTRFRLTSPLLSTAVDNFLSNNPQITDLGCDVYRAPQVGCLASLQSLSLDGIDIAVVCSIVESLPNPTLLHTLKISVGSSPFYRDLSGFRALSNLKNLWIKSPPRHKALDANDPTPENQIIVQGSSAFLLSFPSLEMIQVSGGFPFPVDIAECPALGDEHYWVPADYLRHSIRVLEPGGVFDFDFYTLLSRQNHLHLSHWRERPAETIMWKWANSVSPYVTMGMLKFSRSMPHLKTVFYAPWGTTTRFAYLDVIIDREGKAGPTQEVKIRGGFHCGIGVLQWPQPGTKSSRPKRSTSSLIRGRHTKSISVYRPNQVHDAPKLFDATSDGFTFDFSRMTLSSDMGGKNDRKERDS